MLQTFLPPHILEGDRSHSDFFTLVWESRIRPWLVPVHFHMCIILTKKDAQGNTSDICVNRPVRIWSLELPMLYHDSQKSTEIINLLEQKHKKVHIPHFTQLALSLFPKRWYASNATSFHKGTVWPQHVCIERILHWNVSWCDHHRGSWNGKRLIRECRLAWLCWS